MMETTMYNDGENPLKKMKSSMTLDFNTQKTKQQKFSNLLSSPDMGLLKLASPELERMIIQTNGMVTTTPTPTQFLFPRSVTEEQEAYARGFVDALAELRGKEAQRGEDPVSDDSVDASNPASFATLTNVTVPNARATSLAQSSFTTTTSLPGSVLTSNTLLDDGNHILGSVVTQGSLRPSPLAATSPLVPKTVPARIAQIKREEPVEKMEESQIVPCLGNTPPLSPINMESQERIKLERKRARNRVAAHKCRTRKLERISRLEDRVAELKGQNAELTQNASTLREQVMKLKQQIMEHVNSGCQVMLSPNLK